MRLTLIIVMSMASIVLQAQENSQSNKHFWHSEYTDAGADRVWQIWTDVSNWKSWDTGLKDAEMKDRFRLNASGIMTTLEGRKTKFKVVEYEEGRSYTFKTNLPLGSLYVKRYLKEEEGRTLFTHEVWFKGLTKGIFSKAFGGKFRKMLPDVLEKIKIIAEHDDRT
ncbi:MAG: SRPBCC family protein [Bacteroidota bacterium]